VIPTQGRIVLYRLSVADAEEVNERRADAQAFRGRVYAKGMLGIDPGAEGRTGHVQHIGIPVGEGDEFPAIIVAVSQPQEPLAWLVNLKVELDGTDSYWATSRAQGDQPGRWSWPVITRQPQQPQLGDLVHYVSYGTPRGEYKSVCRAAYVTEGPHLIPGTFNEPGGEALSLCVLNPTGQFFNQHVLRHDGDIGHDHAGTEIPAKSYQGGTWHPAGHA
jgi:hypothetical protein